MGNLSIAKTEEMQKRYIYIYENANIREGEKDVDFKNDANTLFMAAKESG